MVEILIRLLRLRQLLQELQNDLDNYGCQDNTEVMVMQKAERVLSERVSEWEKTGFIGSRPIGR